MLRTGKLYKTIAIIQILFFMIIIFSLCRFTLRVHTVNQKAIQSLTNSDQNFSVIIKAAQSMKNIKSTGMKHDSGTSVTIALPAWKQFWNLTSAERIKV